MNLANQKIYQKTKEQLTELSKKRRDNQEIASNKQDIVAELVNKAHQKECK